MLLENKNAVIYGAAGGIGRGVAKTFAREGARVFLAGRTLEKLEALAAEITAAGGAAEAAVVDALDEDAVNEHAQRGGLAGGQPGYFLQPDPARRCSGHSHWWK